MATSYADDRAHMRVRAYVAPSYVGDATMPHIFLPESLSARVWPWNLEVPAVLAS